MCTLSWTVGSRRLAIIFNRDERRTRLPAEAPALVPHADSAFLAPRDGDAGGTWISVNEHGLALCLLNRYQDASGVPPGARSRGLLVRELASSPGAAALRVAIGKSALLDYAPFTLVAFVMGERPECFAWDGGRLAISRLDPEQRPLSSSSFETEAVLATRRKTMREALAATTGEYEAEPEAEALEALATLHRSHLPERGAYSVCMHRPDASTVSFTEIVIDAEAATMRYAPGPPCETPLGAPLRLALRAGR